MSKLTAEEELEQLIAERNAKKSTPAVKVEEKPVETVSKKDEEWVAFGLRKDETGRYEVVMLKYNNKGECVLLNSQAFTSKSIAQARAGEALARHEAKLSLSSIFKGSK